MSDFPDRTIVALIRRNAEDAFTQDRPLVISDHEQLSTILKMADKIIDLTNPHDDPYKLELVQGLGRGSIRALRANGITDLFALADTDPADINAYCRAEGVVPRGYEDWPQMARTLIDQIEGLPSEPAVKDSSILTQINGIGDKMAEALWRFGVVTLADMAQADPDKMRKYLIDQGLNPTSKIETWPDQAHRMLRGDDG